MLLRHGGPRGSNTRSEGRVRSPSTADVSPRPRLESVCAAGRTNCRRWGSKGPFPSLAAVGFAALGFPSGWSSCTLFSGTSIKPCAAQSGVRSRVIAYAVSGLAALLHISAAWTEAPVPAPLGMRLLTYSFVALAIPLAAVTRRRAGAGRALWAAALAIFAVSALSPEPTASPGEASWPVELVGHHASLPLAFAIPLPGLSDSPFADLFPETSHGLCSRSSRSRSRRFATFGRPICRLCAICPGQSETDDGVGHVVGSPPPCFTPSCVAPPHGSLTRLSCIGPITHRYERPSPAASQSCDTVPTLFCLWSPNSSDLRVNARFVTWRERTSSPQDGALGAVVIGGE
jgi:hypothetical protein